ncbi:MAG TPA: serine--tRNA ligase, partial [Erythrobacter sp.]|nr:serine--tRNA ligase [Erythrobacter sp.]
MHDIRSIRDNPEAFDAALARRGAAPAAAAILELDQQRRAVTTRIQEAQSRRN